MNKTFTIGAIIAAGLIIALAPKHHVGPDYLYPNATVTSGVAVTLSVDDLNKSYNGQTYSQSHRNVPDSEKKQVMNEYGNPTGKIEIDHFYPMCAGGSNDIHNLWAQPEHNMWNGIDYGFHAKDRLEAWVCREIKAGKLDPKVAFDKITNDWVAYYNEVNNLTSEEDTDD